MDWKCMLIVCLIMMALDGSVAKKRQLLSVKAPVCLKCFEEIEALKKPDGSGPAERIRYKPHFMARLGFRKDLPPSCIACTKLLQMKGKSRNHPRVKTDSFKNPKRGTTFDPNFLFFRRQVNVAPKRPTRFPRPSISTTPSRRKATSPLPMKAYESGANVNYHYHYHYHMHSTSGSDLDVESTDEESESDNVRPIAAVPIKAPDTDSTSACSAVTTAADSTTDSAPDSTTICPAVAPAADSTADADASSASAPAAESTTVLADSSASASAADSTEASEASSESSPASDSTTAPATDSTTTVAP